MLSLHRLLASVDLRGLAYVITTASFRDNSGLSILDTLQFVDVDLGSSNQKGIAVIQS